MESEKKIGSQNVMSAPNLKAPVSQQGTRPFNSSSRVFYRAVKNNNLHITTTKLKKLEVPDNNLMSPELKCNCMSMGALSFTSENNHRLDVTSATVFSPNSIIKGTSNTSVIDNGQVSSLFDSSAFDASQIQQALKQHFENIIKLKPSCYQKYLDQAKSKIHQDAVIFGKPNVLVNREGFSLGKFIHHTLSRFTVQELIKMAETYSMG